MRHVIAVPCRRMRLVLTRASSHYVNLDECLYKCDCGEEAEYIVMREE